MGGFRNVPELGRTRWFNPRTRHIQALQSSLKEYYPQGLGILSGNVAWRLASDFLKKWPSFQAFRQAKPSTVKVFDPTTGTSPTQRLANVSLVALTLSDHPVVNVAGMGEIPGKWGTGWGE